MEYSILKHVNGFSWKKENRCPVKSKNMITIKLELRKPYGEKTLTSPSARRDLTLDNYTGTK